MSRFLCSDSIPLEDKERFDELLESVGIHSGLFGCMGGWLISNDGDLLGVKPLIPSKYPILREQHNQQDWIMHLSTKSWFDAHTKEDFDDAFQIATALIKITL